MSETTRLLREMRERYERGEGPHPLSGWAKSWGESISGTGGYAAAWVESDNEV